MTTQTQAVLAVLLEDPSEYLYGLQISKSLGYPSGTVYPILARLEVADWVESAWEEIDPAVEGRRRRRYYRLTGEGERAAREVLTQTIKRLAPRMARPYGDVAPA